MGDKGVSPDGSLNACLPDVGYRFPDGKLNPFFKEDDYTLPDGSGTIHYAIFEPARFNPQTKQWERTEPRGTILVGEGVGDFGKKEYNEFGPRLLAEGYRLIIPDWRGQGRSSRFLTGTEFERSYIPNFESTLGDLRSFYDGVVKPNQTGPLVLLGHSMGSLAFMRWLSEGQKDGKPPEVAGAILSSPPLAFQVPPNDAPPFIPSHVATWMAPPLSAAASAFGLGASYAPGQHNYNHLKAIFAGNPYTSDKANFDKTAECFETNPQLIVGGFTNRMLHVMTTAADDLKKPGAMERINTPVLALLGGRDPSQDVEAVAAEMRRIPGATVSTLPEARHEVLNETPEITEPLWQDQIVPFLNRIVPPAAAPTHTMPAPASTAAAPRPTRRAPVSTPP